MFVALSGRRVLSGLLLLPAAGCLNVPHRALLPVYQQPAGFSETYHDALKAHEPILWPAGEAPPSVYGGVSGPVFAGPGMGAVVIGADPGAGPLVPLPVAPANRPPAAPPLEW